MPREIPPYDIALSVAGEDRSFAASLAEILRAKGLRVFYDALEPAALSGKDLSEHLKERIQRIVGLRSLAIQGEHIKRVGHVRVASRHGAGDPGQLDYRRSSAARQ